MALAAGQTGHLADHQEGVYQVTHGATAGTARPTLGSASTTPNVVLWNGSVEPTNAANGDVWWDSTNSLLKVKVSGSFVASGSAAYAAKKVEALTGAPRLAVWDTFDRSDAATLGTADSGQSWTATTGSAAIVSNKADPGASTIRQTVDAGIFNGRAGVDLVDWGTAGDPVIMLRFIDASNYLQAGAASSGTLLRITKVVAGAFTTLAGVAFTQPASGVVRLEVHALADQIRLLVNGVSMLTHTLSAGDFSTFGTQTVWGLSSFNAPAAARWDNFYVSS